mgnify:CR=1 FL=1
MPNLSSGGEGVGAEGSSKTTSEQAKSASPFTQRTVTQYQAAVALTDSAYFVDLSLYGELFDRLRLTRYAR